MPGGISLGVGEPDFSTPEPIRNAVIAALQSGETSYTANSGLPELREAICQMTAASMNVPYDPETECLVTVGVSEGLDLTLRALLNAGDQVVVAEPCYVSYIPCIRFAGGVAVTVPTQAADGFRCDPERVLGAITPRTKAIVVASPANPTGLTQSLEDLKAIVEIAEKYGLYIISDEIYARLRYEGVHSSPAQLNRERTILLNGFSKAYAMTGWRVAYACAPQRVLSLLARIHQYTMLCAPRMSQVAALEALRVGEPFVQAMLQEYDERRRFVVHALRAAGLPCVTPTGAFYAFPDIRPTGLSSDEFCERLLDEQRLAVVPGTAFGRSGEGHIRCSYAASMQKLQSAMERLTQFVQPLISREAITQ